MNADIKLDAIDTLSANNPNLAFSQTMQNTFDQVREAFRAYFTADKIRSLRPEEYFQGMGLRDGNFTYELEWKTIALGSIRSPHRLKRLGTMIPKK